MLYVSGLSIVYFLRGFLLTFIEYCVLVVLYIITVVSFIFIYINFHGYKDMDI